MRVRNQDRCPPMVAVFLSMETCSVRAPLEDWTGSFRVVGAEATGAPGRRSFFVPIVGQGDDRKGCGNGWTPRGNLDRGIRSLSVRIRTGISAVDLRTIKNPWPPVAGAGPDPHSWKLKPVYPRHAKDTDALTIPMAWCRRTAGASPAPPSTGSSFPEAGAHPVVASPGRPGLALHR